MSRGRVLVGGCVCVGGASDVGGGGGGASLVGGGGGGAWVCVTVPGARVIVCVTGGGACCGGACGGGGATDVAGGGCVVVVVTVVFAGDGVLSLLRSTNHTATAIAARTRANPAISRPTERRWAASYCSVSGSNCSCGRGPPTASVSAVTW